jgi:Mg2+-importing ATPase
MNRARHPGFFARFLHTRAIHRLFRRMAMLESLAGTSISREMPDVLGKTLTEAARAEPADVLRSLASHADGLTEPEARTALRRAGPNEVEHEKPLPWWQHLWHCYRNPFNLLLTVLAAISWATDDIKAATVITAMVVLSTGLRFWQESRSHEAADQLKSLVSSTATVLRRAQGDAPAAGLAPGASAAGPRRIEVPIRRLVPGDVVVLSAGDMIPADLPTAECQGPVRRRSRP